MAVLITGVAGFIGFHLAKFYLERGAHVVGIDNYFAKEKRTTDLLSKNSRFRFIEQDICISSPLLKDVISSSDKIYHMAALVGQQTILSHPIETLTKNVRGCDLVLEIMAETKCKARLAIASSSCVYGGEALAKEDIPLQIPSGQWRQQPYRLSKMANEISALSYVHEKGIFCAIPRIFNVAGSMQFTPKGMLIPTLIEKALKGHPLTVYGDGNQTRTFCNVKDVVKGLHLLLETEKSNGEVVNLGSDEEVSVLFIAEMIKQICNSTSPIQFVSYSKAHGYDYTETMRCCPDLSKLRRITGFQPSICLRKTLEEAVKDFR